MNRGACVIHSQFVEISIFTLNKEEEHAVLDIFRLECRVANHKKPSRLNLLISDRNRAFSIIMIDFLVYEESFTHNDNTSWTIRLSWYLN